MNNKGFSSTALLLLLFIGVGYFVYQNYQSKQNMENLVTSSVPETFASDWGKYENDVLGFSLSYPKELTFLYDQFGRNNIAGGNLLIQNFDGSSPRDKTPTDFQIVIVVYEDDERSLEELANASDENFEMTILGGERAIRGTSTQKYESVPTVWIRNSGFTYTIQLSHPNSTNAIWFDQILSTLQFSN